MLGPPKSRCLDQPIAVSLEDLVPANHFYRHLETNLDLSFVRELVVGVLSHGADVLKPGQCRAERLDLGRFCFARKAEVNPGRPLPLPPDREVG